MLRSLFVFCLAVPFVSAVDDTLAKGSVRFKSRVRLLSAENYLDANEAEVPIFQGLERADYDDHNLDMEVAWGWDSRITVLAATSYRERIVKNASGEVESSGVPGVYLAMRQRLSPMGSDSKWIAETGVRLPAEGDVAEPLPLESEGIDWVMLTSYGQYFYPTRGSFDMDFGYRFRNGDPADEVFFDTSLNIDLRRLAMLRLFYNVTESIDESEEGYEPLAFPNDRGHQILGVELERMLSRTWTVSVGYQELLKGRNQYESSGFRLSVTWRK